MRKFYRFIPNGERGAGVIYAPEDWPYPIAEDGKPVKNWNESLVLELRDGKYTPYTNCIGEANIVDEELKALIESYTGDDPNIEYYPIKVVSDKYGDKLYYIIHFKEVYSDVINKKYSDYHRGSVIKYALQEEKVKDLKVFCAVPGDIVVCPELAKDMKARKLDFGTYFSPVWCVREDE